VTEQYLLPDINQSQGCHTLEISSYDYREVGTLVPTGTTATMQGLKIPAESRLVQLELASVLAPNPAESVTVRLYRIRPANNPAGFGYILLNDPFVLNSATFPGAGVPLDISSTIRENRSVLAGEYLAASWVHSGPQQLRPLNMNWRFAPVDPLVAKFFVEPPADTTSFAAVFG